MKSLPSVRKIKKEQCDNMCVVECMQHKLHRINGTSVKEREGWKRDGLA